ncbi:MAG: hypothetical protein K2F81_09615 [Ruminococcus sp.]|nr:hypothetical protein [Ruminococcus sp.]
MRKFISLLITLCLAFCAVSSTASASLSQSGISPYYLYANDVEPKASWTGSNSVYFTCEVTGESAVTQIKVYLYLEEYYNGSWRNVDSVTKTVNAKSTKASKTYTSAVKGRKYRAYASVFVYSGSAYEHVEKRSSTI